MWDTQAGADTRGSGGAPAGAAALPGGVLVDAYLHFEALLHPPLPLILPQVH